jgi:hypothetical protein
MRAMLRVTCVSVALAGAAASTGVAEGRSPGHGAGRAFAPVWFCDVGTHAISARAAVNGPGPDPDAPAGAPGSWLPNEPWVMTHWLPYRESDLLRVLNTNRVELRAWLNRRPLADLARAKGTSVAAVVEQLMRPVRSEYPSAYSTLLARALRTFSQRHLMQHMLFHPFHTPAFNAMVPKVVGLRWPEIIALRRSRLSIADIMRRQHRNPDAGMRKVRAAMVLAARRGVSTQSTPRLQARAFLDEQERALPLRWNTAPGEHTAH